VKIIAEVGSNWRCLDDCLRSVRKAKEVGADIVKFQYYTHKKLYGYAGTMEGELPKEYVRHIAEMCELTGIEFMCSVFDPVDVPFIDPFVKRHKLASAEIGYKALIDAMAATGKEVLVSDGCMKPVDYEYLNKSLKDFVIMVCCPEYPAKRHILKDMHSYPQGVSDHSLDIYQTPIIAKRAGAMYLEKHFTALPELDTPDRAHSLTPDEFSEMVRFIKTGNRTEQPMPAWKRRDTEYGYYRPKL
jgi:N-acetylneuraminate synthase